MTSLSWKDGTIKHEACLAADGTIVWITDSERPPDMWGNKGSRTEDVQTILEFRANGPPGSVPMAIVEEIVALVGGDPGWLPLLRLHHAASAGELAAVQALLGQGVSPDIVVNGITALYAAVRERHEEVATVLLAASRDVNVPCTTGQTVLHATAQSDGISVAFLRALLAAGADVDARDDAGETPLFPALRSRHWKEVVPVLLEAGARVSVVTLKGARLLHLEVQGPRRPEVAQFLLAHGADVDARDGKDWTALRWAVDKQVVRFVELLLEAGATPTAAMDEQARSRTYPDDRGNQSPDALKISALIGAALKR